MTTLQIAALPGDGTGPEVMAQALRLLREVEALTGLGFTVDEIPCGGQYYLQHGERDWPIDAEARCDQADAILLGAVGWPAEDGTPVTMADGKMAGWSPVIGNRTRLELFANVRPVKLYPGVSHRIHGARRQVWQPEQVDLVIVRENTEGLYSGLGEVHPPSGPVEVATDIRRITRAASERVIRHAFELSRSRKRGAPVDGKKRLTCIVKDNVLLGCKLFVEVFHQVGREYADVEQEVAIVDAFTQWLVGQPEHYDVCVTTNMFGDIVTDLASVLQGGMGMAVGCNVGDHAAMFEPIHGSAPRHAGQDKVNPLAMLLATGEALRWLGQKRSQPQLSEVADQIEAAIICVLRCGRPLTYDLVGPKDAASMSEVTTAVLEQLRASVTEDQPYSRGSAV